MKKSLISLLILIFIVSSGCQSQETKSEEEKQVEDVSINNVSDSEQSKDTRDASNNEVESTGELEEDDTVNLQETEGQDLDLEMYSDEADEIVYETLVDYLAYDENVVSNNQIMTELWNNYLSFVYEEIELHLGKVSSFDKYYEPINLKFSVAADRYRADHGLEYPSEMTFSIEDLEPYAKEANVGYDGIKEWEVGYYYSSIHEVDGALYYTQQERSFLSYEEAMDQLNIEIIGVESHKGYVWITMRKWSEDLVRYKDVFLRYNIDWNHTKEMTLVDVKSENGSLDFDTVTLVTGSKKEGEPFERIQISENMIEMYPYEKMDELFMLGETEDDLYFYGYSWNTETAYIQALNKDTLEETGLYTYETESESIYIADYPSFLDDKIAVIGNEEIVVLDEDLQVYDEIPLAPSITSNWDHILGIDISKDLNTILLDNESGLYLFDNANDKAIELVAEHRPYYHVYRKDYLRRPSFVGPDENIMAVLFMYEGIGATFFYDRDDKVGKYFDFRRQEINYNYSQGDYITFTDNRQGFDWNGNQDNVMIMFNYTDLNYYYVEDAPYFCGGFLLEGFTYNGKNHSAMVMHTESIIGNWHVLDQIVYKFNYETREFEDEKLFIPGEMEGRLVGVQENGKVLILVKGDEGEFLCRF